MAINRITDLPNIADRDDFSLSNFLSSKMEISYLANPVDKSIFVSNQVGCDVLVSAVASAITEQGLAHSGNLSVFGGLYVSEGFTLSGDVNINTNSKTKDYSANINFKAISAFSENAILSSSNSATIAAGDAEVEVDANSETVHLHKYATVDETTDAPDSVVNMSKLLYQLADLSARIKASQIGFPPLAIIYSDHKPLGAASDSWLSAGSSFDLDEHPLIKDTALIGELEQQGLIDRGNSETRGWKYRLSNNDKTMTLPKVDTIMQIASSGFGTISDTSIKLPDISITNNLKVSCTGGWKQTVSGSLSASYSSNASQTPVMQVLKMNAYFYVGPRV